MLQSKSFPGAKRMYQVVRLNSYSETSKGSVRYVYKISLGRLATEALAGVPGIQSPQSLLSLLTDTGPAQYRVQCPAVDRHVLGHVGVRMGELYELHRCWNLRTE